MPFTRILLAVTLSLLSTLAFGRGSSGSHTSSHSSSHATSHASSSGTHRSTTTGLSHSSSSSVSVRGYTRKNGTVVAPYHRSAPDHSKANNWSTKGNINPYTGKIGTKKPS